MTHLYPSLLLDALKHVRYPGTGEDIVSSGMVQDDIRIEGMKVSFSIRFPKANDPFSKSLIKAAEQAILTYASPEAEIKGNITALFEAPKPEVKENPLEDVRNIIAVFSGKGGVGKSTLTANLAVSLARKGYKVGLLDADIYGPSMPKMFGCEEARPIAEQTPEGDKIVPVEVMHGIKLLSIGFFVDVDKALVWRGVMASNALGQLIKDALWRELDYLLIDMPPGTSDIHLTLVQTVGITGAIVVTTPQEIALIDARKGVDMFTADKVSVPILGIVENMSWFTPAELPENKYYIFGNGGGKRLAEELNVPLLAQIPLVQGVCEGGDTGVPVAAREESLLASYFAGLADRVIEQVALRNESEPPTQKVEITT
ncbi:Mrp/NBP35 family ATP-binding protein [Porphyromonas circumdentaria]|uniref:Mrp/NBP35 family ATP-binding protein n=1 Tax=Porphyromonas circumdentaria TaxID=29524 RepID=UPI0026DB5B1D|nr:Mrp/NBP35 family ATP-binding protein [Porphyromonas circumdentaria]MDO4722229.1 Mrp/NBP35 family ATP-binding protein [Porphyromonas circumdentaria]